MRTWPGCLAIAFVLGGGPRAPRAAPHPIATINAVIGDASFVRAFGRAPTPDDDPGVRVTAHLAYVELLLRDAPVSGWTAPARAARRRALDHLHRYWRAGRFPAAETAVGLLPTFIDRAGARCAVAYLMEQDLGEAAIRAIDRRYHNAYIAEIAAPEIAEWAATTGLSRDELAMIQPSYPPVPLGGIRLELGLAAEYGNAVSRDAGSGELTHEALLRGRVRRIFEQRWLGAPILGLDGAAGWAAGGQLAYDAHLTVGSQAVFYWMTHGSGTPQLLGATAGIGIDAIGDRVPRAWTIPVDVYWYRRLALWWNDPTRGTPDRVRFGLIAGPRFAIAGADRRLGWRAAVDIVLRNLIDTEYALAPRDAHVELGVERVADAIFVNIALGIRARSRFGLWAD
ncbi:MAG TPA: hypothetical protein VFK02_28345 [Kofleriaceae bacterium]|nr:hypothetical protein [Kofleriaceae bacterium]